MGQEQGQLLSLIGDDCQDCTELDGNLHTRCHSSCKAEQVPNDDKMSSRGDWQKFGEALHDPQQEGKLGSPLVHRQYYGVS